ncbi:MAG: monooxygenase [Gammaproteobacteria bacterium]|nr:monooxygenase [Gammaproteobacteria bacterium]
MQKLNVLIIGAGIGGLTTALCCAKKGYSVIILEQSDTADSGVGIQLSPNCSRVLHALGLGPGLSVDGCQPEAAEIRDWKSGNLIASAPLGMRLRQLTGYPYYHVSRDDLIRLLLEKIDEEPLIQLRYNTRIFKFVQYPTSVVALGDGVEFSGDLLVGADGIHSTIKQSLFGQEEQRFTGHVAWRVTLPVEKLPSNLTKSVAGLWWGPKKHFVHYLIKCGTYLNCVGIVENTSWEKEEWMARGKHDEFLEDFSGWHKDIVSLIEHADPLACYKWALFDRYPLASWSAGRVALLGDACHPTLPFMAQGAAMAIEDAAVIAHCLNSCKNIEEGLKIYESLRRKRTERIQCASRRNADIFHMSGFSARLRNMFAAIMMKDTMNWIYKYDPLNTE